MFDVILLLIARCMFILGDEYDLWERHPIWTQLKIALPIYHTDPYLVDTIAAAVSDFGRVDKQLS